MDRVNFVDIKNINLVSNVVPEVRSGRNIQNTSNESTNRRSEAIRTNPTSNQLRASSEMASKYEKVGDAYERVSLYESAINSYQVSYTLNPNPNLVEKIDNTTLKIVNERLKGSSR